MQTFKNSSTSTETENQLIQNLKQFISQTNSHSTNLAFYFLDIMKGKSEEQLNKIYNKPKFQIQIPSHILSKAKDLYLIET